MLCAFFQEVGKVLAAERGVTAQKGICDDAHGPHVDGFAVAFAVHDFRGGVAKRAGHCAESLFLAVQRLGNAKIGQYKVGSGLAGDIEQVFGLEICSVTELAKWYEDKE